MNSLARVSAQNQAAVREGLKIVRKLVATNPYPDGFTTAELFKLAVKEAPPADYKYENPPLRLAARSRGGNQKNTVPLPPHPDHPIRSMTFLKHSVLPILEGNKELEIVRTTRIPFNPAPPQRASGKRKTKQETSHAASAAAPAPVTVWAWKTVDKSRIPRPPAPKPKRKVFGVEVGVGEDWSHLNKRRRRARAGKVRRDVTTMKAVILAKKEAAQHTQIPERNLTDNDKKTKPEQVPKQVVTNYAL